MKFYTLIQISVVCLFILSNFSDAQPIKSNQITNNVNSTSREIDTDVISIINKINKSIVSSYLEGLVGCGIRYTGTKNCNKAAEYIYNQFKQMGLDVEYQNWKIPFIKGKNVIATKPGSDPESDAVFIICAHYDTWKNTVGANDDGSGIAVMLTIANITRQFSFNHTLRFLAVSGHETWPAYTYGSTAYAKKAYEEKDNIVCVLNLDMIGNTTKTGNAIQMYGRTRSIWILDFVKVINEKYHEYFDIMIETFYNNLGADETRFLDYGYDAISFIQSNYWEPPNHVPEDDLSTINFDFLTNATKLILAATTELANKPIDIQIQITRPYEGYAYLFDRSFLKLPNFNYKEIKFRGKTYILGGDLTVKVNVETDDEIKSVYFILDNSVSYKKVVTKPPYEFKITKDNCESFYEKGKHTIGVKVITYSGKTAFDEMDIIIK